MNSNYKIIICSDIDYEKLIAEIYFQDKFIALINQEEGEANLQIEFPSCGLNEDAIVGKVNLEEFKLVLEEAKNKLIGDQKTKSW